jgi:hypothetical protein
VRNSLLLDSRTNSNPAPLGVSQIDRVPKQLLTLFLETVLEKKAAMCDIYNDVY